MFVKIYKSMWTVVVMAAAGLYFAGGFTMLTAVVFGFVCFGLVFMGMMCVLPSTVSHQVPVRQSANGPMLERMPKGLGERLRWFTAAWVPSNGVEVRRPKYR